MYRSEQATTQCAAPLCSMAWPTEECPRCSYPNTHTRPILLENDIIPSLLHKKETVFFLLAVHRPIYRTV